MGCATCVSRFCAFALREYRFPSTTEDEQYLLQFSQICDEQLQYRPSTRVRERGAAGQHFPIRRGLEVSPEFVGNWKSLY